MKFTLRHSYLSLCVGALFLTGCQTLPHTTPNPVSHTVNAPIEFNISGKIGITSVSADGSQSGTAFYTWAQEGDRFAIDLTGALGIGATAISFDGQTAMLSSERTGTISATTPEALLLQATGWQAPISQLPHWIVGRSAPSDTQQGYDQQGKLIHAVNGDWTASFEYKSTLPNRLRITHTDGHRVVMTIVHGK